MVLDTKRAVEIGQLGDELVSIANRYPPAVVPKQVRDIKRIVFQVGLIQEKKGTDISLCDIGGGIGLFPIACSLVGMNVTLVDDFRDPVNTEHNQQVLSLHESLGIRVVNRDVVQEGIDFEPESFDAVTSFHSMEHWHHSPKRLFASVVQALRPGGLFVLAGPNAVNLGKRITVPMGRGKWSQMRDWYEQDVFRGHVREPDVSDLLYIARDMHLIDVQVIGRNWLAYKHTDALVRRVTPFLDRLLQRVPSLCTDLYLIGTVDKRSELTGNSV
jgi:2-polyprenyl-3-methyl-5-hydroxy-6-metoxy-1,4-benzoquinol methylase